MPSSSRDFADPPLHPPERTRTHTRLIYALANLPSSNRVQYTQSAVFSMGPTQAPSSGDGLGESLLSNVVEVQCPNLGCVQTGNTTSFKHLYMTDGVTTVYFTTESKFVCSFLAMQHWPSRSCQICLGELVNDERVNSRVRSVFVD